MTEEPLLIQAFDFVARSPIYGQESIFEWYRKISRLYDQGCLYGVFLDNRLIALAGAYRIEDWNERFFQEPPDESKGDKLFISFFLSECNRRTDAMQLLRSYLRRNPDITEILFHEKYRRQLREPKEGLKSRRIIRIHAGRFDQKACFYSRPGIRPPELISLRDEDLELHHATAAV